MRFALPTVLLTSLWAFVATCSISTGPAGEFACISISRYSGKQYATCLTNTYIKLKSGGNHQCENSAATYCYYQCMIELHNVNSGSVTNDCSCENSTISATTTPFSGTTLPPSCYSPSGEDCSWYTDCLERKITCGPETGYAIGFGKKYCELYATHYKELSKLAQQWVDAVRKCLQVSVVPLIRQFYHPTCEEVKKTAISSHTGCYLSPSVGQPSICDVIHGSIDDVLTIFMTIKGAFFENDRVVTWGTWKSSAAVLYYCASQVGNQLNRLNSAIFEAKIIARSVFNSKLLLSRRKRSAETDPGEIGVRFATALSNSLGWKALGIDWIPLAGNFTPIGEVTIRLWIGDQRKYDLNRNFTQPMNLQAEMQRLKTAVQNGEAFFNLTDGPFYMRQLAECGNLNCTEVNSTTVAPAEPRSWQVLVKTTAAVAPAELRSAEVTRGLLVIVLGCALLGLTNFE